MMECERVFEVEDLILGHDVAPDLRRHLAGCAACREGEAMFREEHALFVARQKPPPRRRVPLKRWATLAIAAGLAFAGSAIRSEVTKEAPAVLACTMPQDGETLACMMQEPVTFSRGTP